MMIKLFRTKKISFAIFLINFFQIFFVSGQSAINHPLGDISTNEEVITYKGNRNYKFTERSDLRVYQNGKYIGLQSKIVSAFIIPCEDRERNVLVYEGDFYVDQDTTRNKAQVALGIHEAIPSSFVINDDGNLTMLVDNGYPSFRSFPAFSSHKIKKGDVWQAKAMRAVDPLSKGIVTKMPIYVQYTYTGDDVYKGEPVYLISAQWATRYGSGGTTLYVDWGGDKELSYAQGSHKATIIVSKKTGAALVIRDNVDELFAYTDGNKYQFKGTISLFTEYPPAIDRSKLIAALKQMELLDDEYAEKLLHKKDESNSYKSYSEELYSETLDSNLNLDTISADIESADKVVVEAVNATESKSERLKQQIQTHQEKAVSSVLVSDTEAGICLTMHNLQFKPDSAQLLAGEEQRLDQIAEILKLADGAKFLIEGHTARTGNEAGEMKLSKERADSIAQALVKRGISSDRFICKGSGSKKPVAANNDEAGKSLNRRVEITILE